MLFGWLWPGISGLLLTHLFLFVPPGSGAADSCHPDQLSHERTVLVESFAKEKLCYWQNRLDLDGWKVSLAVVRSTALRPNTLGNIRWDLEKKTATIRVLDPADYSMPFREMLNDIEFTVVHELIHLKRDLALDQYPRSEAGLDKEEHAVNQVTETLVKSEHLRQ